MDAGALAQRYDAERDAATDESARTLLGEAGVMAHAIDSLVSIHWLRVGTAAGFALGSEAGRFFTEGQASISDIQDMAARLALQGCYDALTADILQG